MKHKQTRMRLVRPLWALIAGLALWVGVVGFGAIHGHTHWASGSTAHAEELETDNDASVDEEDSNAASAETTEDAEAGDTDDGTVGEVEVEDAQVLDAGLITGICALLIAGFAAVLGIWVDRDRDRPIIFAMAMSVLIITAVFVGIAQAYLDTEEILAREEDLARMLEMVAAIAASTGDTELAEFLDEEMETQADRNPQVTKRIETRSSARGGGQRSPGQKPTTQKSGGKSGGKGL